MSNAEIIEKYMNGLPKEATQVIDQMLTLARMDELIKARAAFMEIIDRDPL